MTAGTQRIGDLEISHDMEFHQRTWTFQRAAWLVLALVLAAALAALIGMRSMKKIEKPERTMESLRELPDVMRREPPGQRRRDLPTVAHGAVARRDPDTYLV